jgi:putative ABC transport system substrate-binding protein
VNNRRKLLVALGAGVLAVPFDSSPQQHGKVWRIGYVGTLRIEHASRYFKTFREELQRMGYIDGKTIVIEYRASQGQLDRIPDLVQQLVNSKVDVLVVNNIVAIRAARRSTTTIPIVMATAVDPVAAGFVHSLRQPGGNITGISSLLGELSARRIELLKELVPDISRAAILWDADGPGPRRRFQDYLTVAKTLKLQIQSLEVKGPTPDLEKAFQAAQSGRAQALLIISNPSLLEHRQSVMALTARHALPSIAENKVFVERGGLISYAADAEDQAKNLAKIVAKILNGARPAELPVEQTTKFELVVNLRTAKTLGITVPQSVLIQATRVIE